MTSVVSCRGTVGTSTFTKLNWKAPVRQEIGGGQSVWVVNSHPDTGSGLPQATTLSLGPFPIRADKLVLLLGRSGKSVKNKSERLAYTANIV